MKRVPYESMYARLVANTVEDEAGCWLWTGRVNNSGYPVLARREDGVQHPVKRYAHRMMLEEWHGYYFPLDEAGHTNCYKTLCIRPGCLEIQAPAHNLAERRRYEVRTIRARWIPVLYPTPARELAEVVDAFLDHALDFAGPPPPPSSPCPF